MIELCRALDKATILVAPSAIAMIEPPPDHAESGAVLIVAGQRVAVVETVSAIKLLLSSK